jgi:predicted dinucleotide-binding enzyme
MHIAGFVPNWINRSILWMGFAYPFLQLKCKVLIGRVASTNHKALKLDKHLGFKEIARIPDAVPNGDVIILTMRREECHWLNAKINSLNVLQHEVNGTSKLVRLTNG